MCKDASLPRRPYIPTTLYVLAALVIVDRMMLGEGIAWLGGTCGRMTVLASGVILVVAGLGVLKRWPWSPVAFVVAVAMALAVVSASCELERGERFVEALGSGTVSSWEFYIETDPLCRNDTYRCRALAVCDKRASGRVWLSLPQQQSTGDIVRCVGSFAPNADDDWGTTSRQQGVWGSVRAVRLLEVREEGGALGMVRQVRRYVLNVLEPESSEENALIAGCLCGWRGGLVSFGLDELFARCGLAHLIAVSGSHLAVFSSMLTVLLVGLRVRPRIRVGVLGACCGMFVLLCGVPPSAVRALIMQLAALVGSTAGRRSHALSAVSVAGILMVAWEPAASGQLGFLLSLCAVAGLCVFSAYGSYVLKTVFGTHALPRWLPRKLRFSVARFAEQLRDSVAASLVAQLATLPLVVDAYGEVSLVGPLAGAVVGLPFNLFVTVSLAGVVLQGIPVVGSALLAAARLLSWALLSLARACGAMPFASVAVTNTDMVRLATGAVMLVVLIAWPTVNGKRLRKACVLACVVVAAMLVRWRYFAPARLCVLDVGQGDAILIQQGASAVLVDAGPGDAVVDALARCHVLHLDGVVVTHLHADHYEGVGALAGHVGCDQVFVAQGVGESIPQDVGNCWRELTGADVRELAWGDVMRVGDFYLRVVWPEQPVAGTTNEDSLEIVLTYDEQGRKLCALLTGDAEQNETGAVIARGSVGDIDMLKVGHHGSHVSIDAAEALALDPEVAVASAGEDNSYGHPDPTCVQILEDAGAQFLCTKDVGDVEVLPGDKGPVVHVQRAT